MPEALRLQDENTQLVADYNGLVGDYNELLEDYKATSVTNASGVW